jgi:hydroxyacylglutathione hydrolase
VLPPDLPLLLMGGGDAAGAAQARDAATQLLRVGLDRVEGTIDGGFEAWRASSLPSASLRVVRAEELRDAAPDLYLVDVRTEREWRADHVPGAVNIPVGELAARIGELPSSRAIGTICEGGYRSSLAASLLAQEGIPGVVNIAGGMAAYRGLPEAAR